MLIMNLLSFTKLSLTSKSYYSSFNTFMSLIKFCILSGSSPLYMPRRPLADALRIDERKGSK